MKKHVSKFLLMAMLTLSLGMTAFATDAPSLDDIVAGSSVQTEVTQNSTVVEDNKSAQPEMEYTNRSFADSLSGAMDLSSETKISSDFSKTANYYGSIAFQWLAIIVSVGILIMVALDMVFITLPFTRSFLANGYMGNPNSSNPNGIQQGAAMGSSMGMGGMGGMGGRRMGGGIFGGRGMMNQNAMGQQTAMQNQPALGRVQYVSNAALNAVSTESASNRLALIEYLKDMSITIIFSSVILVLAGTGILGTLGLKIGEKLVALIRTLIASLA